jgi:hypothetical protein
MDERAFRIQIRHIRSCLASLRLFDLHELAESVQQYGTDDEKVLVAALLLALETLPDDGGH